MKKFLIVFSIVLMSASAVKSQGFRLNGYALYSFDDKVDSYYSNTQYFEGKIKGGLTWGIGAEFLVKRDYGIELSYYRMDTEAPTTYYNLGVKNATFDVALNWIMLGGVRYLRVQNPKIEPYAGGMLGVGIVDSKNPANGNSQSATKFAWGLKGGVNIWASDRIGIKLQTNLMSMTQAFGGGLYFGTGGAGAGVNSYSSLLQFSLGGGLTFKLGANGAAAPAKTVR
jgi:hypothetical protein